MKKNINSTLTYDEVQKRFMNKGLKLLSKKYKNNHTLLDCEDNNGYRFNIAINDLDKFRKRKLVYIKNKWSLYNIKKYITNNEIDVQLVSQKYIGSKYPLAFRCKCGSIFYKPWEDFYSRNRYLCVSCAKKSNKKLSFYDVKKKFLEHNLYILDDNYIANNKNLLCETNEGYLIKKSYSNINKDYKSNIFSYKNNKDNYVYNVNNYFKINNINCICVGVKEEICGVHGQHYLDIICSCGELFKSTIDYIRKGNYRCPKCTKLISNGEESVANILKAYNINYKRQYKFTNCKYKRELPFDFYLPDYNVCIEFDGIYHYEKQKHTTDKQFEEQQIRDKIKDEYCKQNNIKLIRIPYWNKNDLENAIFNELPLKINDL